MLFFFLPWGIFPPALRARHHFIVLDFYLVKLCSISSHLPPFLKFLLKRSQISGQICSLSSFLFIWSLFVMERKGCSSRGGEADPTAPTSIKRSFCFVFFSFFLGEQWLKEHFTQKIWFQSYYLLYFQWWRFADHKTFLELKLNKSPPVSFLRRMFCSKVLWIIELHPHSFGMSR